MGQAGVQLDPNAAWVIAVIKTATTQGGVEVRRQEVTEREKNIVVLVAQPKTATNHHPRQ